MFAISIKHSPTAISSVAAIVLFGFLSIASAAGDSRLPELFIPVIGEELSEIRSRNDYFIKAQLYFAKRHRFVRVDHTVLVNNDEFQITLFPDTTLEVARESVSIEPDTLILWQGAVVSPVNDLAPDQISDAPRERLIELYEQMYTLSLVGVSFDYEPDTGRSFAAQSDRNIEGFRRSREPKGLQKSAFFGFSNEFAIPSLDSVYKLSSLSITPDIHLVYEVDDARLYPRESTSNPKYEPRRRQHEEFLESLGENPRTEWKARHRGETQ